MKAKDLERAHALNRSLEVIDTCTKVQISDPIGGTITLHLEAKEDSKPMAMLKAELREHFLSELKKLGVDV